VTWLEISKLQIN